MSNDVENFHNQMRFSTELESDENENCICGETALCSAMGKGKVERLVRFFPFSSSAFLAN